MGKFVSKGLCMLCGDETDSSGILRHLKSCFVKKLKAEPKESSSDANRKSFFIINIKGRYNPQYWLYIGISSKATFERIDYFLRDIWLECCGHLSDFEFGRECLSDGYVNGIKNRGMKTELHALLMPGSKFTYTYDFGSSTELELKVAAEYFYPENKTKDGIILLGRNIPPKILCDKCGEPATLICPICYYSNEAFFCKKCSKKHKCEEDYFLPVVNSPRTGVCAYTGNLDMDA